MASDMSRQVGRRIRQRRLEMQLNQRQLAERIEADAVDAQRVSDWERGVNQPSPRYLEMLSDTLGRDVAWFYEKETETPDLLGATVPTTVVQTQLDRIESMLRDISAFLGITDRSPAALAEAAEEFHRQQIAARETPADTSATSTRRRTTGS